MADITELKQELMAVAKMCYAGHLQTGNGGNLSARVPGEELMVVKASEVAFSTSTIDDYVVSDFQGNLVEGAKKPSRESLLHGAIYSALPHVGSVVHCHSPWATGWASTGLPLAHATHHSYMKLGKQVKVFDTGSYVVPTEFFPQIIEHLKQDEKTLAFLLRGHGQVALGKSSLMAFYTAELLEETAHIAFVERMLGK